MDAVNVNFDPINENLGARKKQQFTVVIAKFLIFHTKNSKLLFPPNNHPILDKRISVLLLHLLHS